MKQVKRLTAAALVALMALSACACNKSTESSKAKKEDTWNQTAETHKDAMAMFNSFAEKTFQNTNQVVTVKQEGKDFYTETIDGTSDHIVYTDGGTEAYSFVDNGKYIYATKVEDSEYYMEGKESYDYGYFAYKELLLFLDVPEDEKLTYSCVVDGKGNDDEKSETLKLEIKTSDGEGFVVNATSKNGLIETLSYQYSEEGNKSDMQFTFAYGSAKVTVPDISKWEKGDSQDMTP